MKLKDKLEKIFEKLIIFLIIGLMVEFFITGNEQNIFLGVLIFLGLIVFNMFLMVKNVQQEL